MDRTALRLVPWVIMVFFVLGAPAVHAGRNTCFWLWVEGGCTWNPGTATLTCIGDHYELTCLFPSGGGGSSGGGGGDTGGGGGGGSPIPTDSPATRAFQNERCDQNQQTPPGPLSTFPPPPAQGGGGYDWCFINTRYGDHCTSCDCLDCCGDAYASNPGLHSLLIDCKTTCLSGWELGGEQGARGPDDRDTCGELWR